MQHAVSTPLSKTAKGALWRQSWVGAALTVWSVQTHCDGDDEEEEDAALTSNMKTKTRRLQQRESSEWGPGSHKVTNE